MDQGSWRDLRPKPKNSQETLRTLDEVRMANMRLDNSKHPYPGSEQVSDTQVEASSLARSLNRDDVAKMIFIYGDAHTLAAAIKEDELYKSLLQEAESAAIDSQFTKILGTIDNCHKACYAGDYLARLKEEQEEEYYRKVARVPNRKRKPGEVVSSQQLGEEKTDRPDEENRPYSPIPETDTDENVEVPQATSPRKVVTGLNLVDQVKQRSEKVEDAADHEEIAVEEGQVKAYKDLAKALQEYYDIIKNVKAKIETKLYLLAPDGALNLHNMLNDAKTFISNNIEEIVTNAQTEISYKAGVIHTIDRLPETGVQYLGEVLGNKANDPDLRRLAIHTLGKMRDKDALPDLGKVLLDKDEDLVSRRAAAEALGKIHDKDVAPYLVKVLDDTDNHFDLRENAARVLERIAERQEGTIVPDSNLIDVLGKVLGDTDNDLDLRRAAAKALNPLIENSSKEAIKALGKVLLDKDEDLDLRKDAADALGKTRNEGAIKVLGKVLGNKANDLDLRRAAAKALGGSDDKEAIKALEKAHYDTGNLPDLREEALRIVKEMDAETLIKVFASKRCKPRTKRIALKALVEQNNRAIKPSLEKLMFNAKIDKDTRYSIAQVVDAWS